MSARLSSADTAWLHMDRPTNLMVINSVQLFDEPLDWERVKEITQTRLIDRYPRFRQRVVESRLPLRAPRWEDDPDFALEHHLHHLALPAPGDQRGAAGAGRRPDDDAARPQPPAVAHLHGRRVRRRRGDHQPHAPLHRATAIALARVMLSLTDTEPDAGIAAEPEHPSPAASDAAGLAASGGLREAARTGRRSAVRQGSDRDLALACAQAGRRGRARRRHRAAAAAHPGRRGQRDQGRSRHQPAGGVDAGRSRCRRSSASPTPTTRP